MNEIMRPIAARLGFDYEWKREGDRLIQPGRFLMTCLALGVN